MHPSCPCKDIQANISAKASSAQEDDRHSAHNPPFDAQVQFALPFSFPPHPPLHVEMPACYFTWIVALLLLYSGGWKLCSRRNPGNEREGRDFDDRKRAANGAGENNPDDNIDISYFRPDHHCVLSSKLGMTEKDLENYRVAFHENEQKLIEIGEDFRKGF